MGESVGSSGSFQVVGWLGRMFQWAACPEYTKNLYRIIVGSDSRVRINEFC